MERSHQEHAIDSYLAVLRALDTVRLSYWEGCNLTVPQPRLMHLISEVLTPSVGDLAAATNVRPSTVTGLADRLVKRRLIERFLDSADRRFVHLRLSDEGVRVLDGVSAAEKACLRRRVRE